MSNKFKIVFIEEALKEYKKLDGSTKKFVNVAISKIEQKALDIGEELHNTNDSKLAGCRRIKLRKIGIRIVYRVIDEKVEIAEIIAIGKREDSRVYKEVKG